MREDKSSLIGYLIFINIVLLGLIIYSIIAINFYKDVPYDVQHWFGHDLEAYKTFARVEAGIVGGALAIVDVVAIIVGIVHSEKRNKEEK